MSRVLEDHEDEFFEVVDAKHNLLRLKRKKVITESFLTKIESADSANAKELLYDHLHRNADVAALKEYCTMAIAADALPNMQRLGEKMLSKLPPESLLEWWPSCACVCVHLHACVHACVCVSVWGNIGGQSFSKLLASVQCSVGWYGVFSSTLLVC